MTSRTPSSEVEDTSPGRLYKAPMIPDALGYLYWAGRSVFRRMEITHRGSRKPRPGDIHVPAGYEVDVVATDFSAPVHCSFDDDGFCYVAEAGYRIDSPPRIWRLDVATGERTKFFEIPDNQWLRSGALTGTCWHNGYLYYSYNDHIGRIGRNGKVEKVVTGLPGLGDHQLSPPTFGPDGKLYFTTGTATNCGVVGADNIAYEWLRNPELRDLCEVPGQDVVLSGHNFETQDVTGKLRKKVSTGAFVPFGTETKEGQIVEGSVKCNGGVLRCNPDGSQLKLLAWGLRNAFGLRHDSEGRLFVTEHGIDERGGRFIIGDRDDFYEIEQGRWYGYPDYASGVRLDDPRLGDGGRGRAPLIANPPETDPPKPLLTFEPHAASNGFDFSRGGDFGFEGDAFVALFGDAAPVTTRRMVPAGFKVVRIDVRNRRIVDFAVNKIAGGASVLPHEGFERPSHCEFGPDGALYVVDWGEMVPAPERGGVEIRVETGVLWRIRCRPGERRGEAPRKPIVLPVNLFRMMLPLVGTVIGLGVLVWLLTKWIG